MYIGHVYLQMYVIAFALYACGKARKSPAFDGGQNAEITGANEVP